MELNVVTEVKDHKKGNKRKTKENVDPLNEAGDMVIQDMEMAEVLNASFASNFTSKTDHQESQVPAMGGKSGANKVCPWWKRIRSGNT